MKWWQDFKKRLFWDEGRIQRLEQTMVTRQQLDNSLAALPDAVETSVTAALTPLLAPIADKLKAIPNEDFSAEMESLAAIPGAVSKAVSDSVAAVFAPVTAPAATTPATDAATVGG